VSKSYNRRAASLAKIRSARRAEQHQQDTSPKRIGIGAVTPVLCSCFMCGNPRRFNGDLTIRETRDINSFRDQIELLNQE
jgi:hypothetical protein